ncbi:methyltransferase, FkbM family [Pilibacter termitis]|uniref:Methyltransferase, FkbM family n=1 Tax=Pilibacter termitis TaxID=263852 RepID=A0A1T4K1A2_9ENTE|nr:class I SAM-dependent methyltransferase [Pilibacter termitis]SJZ36075.1 methyltransferase, FkbM family [Pilibacter termitis]
MRSEEKFTGKSAFYDAGRPMYPVALFRDLSNLHPHTVLDIGAGSGILTKQLLEYGVGQKVIASEPNLEMHKKLLENLAEYKELDILSSSAEKINLPDFSVDLIVASQAFHWFDITAFRQEAQRLLRRNGWVSLIWNVREENAEVHKETLLAIEKFHPKAKQLWERTDIQEIQRFFGGSFLRKQYQNPVFYDKQGFIHRNLSSSYAPKADSLEGFQFIRDLTKIFETHQKNGQLRYPMKTFHYYGQVRAI